MKYLLLLLLFIGGNAAAQKPMVGYTIEQIKSYNQVEFGTHFWEYRNVPEFIVLSTNVESAEIQTFYYFRHGEDKNVMCAHATKNNITARLLAESVAENSVWVSTNKFYNKKSGLVTEYEYLESGIHSFLFYQE
jgi:hypothetical protein